MDGSQKEGGNFLNLLQKEGVPRKGGSPQKKGGVPTLEESMGCNICYIGEATCHLSTRIKEHLEKDKKSHIFKHLNENHNCKIQSILDCFQIIDSASSKFRLKLKDAMYINWTKPLNR